MENSQSEGLTIEEIVRDYLGLVYSFVFRLVGQESEASDITQEVFVKIWKNLAKYDQEKNLKTWILAIARNTTIDWFRKKRPILFSQLEREVEDLPKDFGENIVDQSPLPEEIFAQEEMREKLEKVIGRLPIKQRDVFILHLEDDLTFEEISELTGQPMNTVKSQYRRALISLKQFLLEKP